ncbi:MAG: hypothetical protein KUG81_09590 [Gammaproteobacteria bacterium]|nr:hypothetical protein [Gammaproteobacteria bacterium]
MWFNLVGQLITGWVGMKKTKYEAEGQRALALAKVEADYDLEALRAQKDSWKDEVFLYVFLSPLVIAWFDSEKAQEWVNFVSQMPSWYQYMLIGMMAAVFGLRWFVKNQNMKIVKGFKS